MSWGVGGAHPFFHARYSPTVWHCPAHPNGPHYLFSGPPVSLWSKRQKRKVRPGSCGQLVREALRGT